MSTLKLIDVNGNLTNNEYSGCYGNTTTKIHKPDLQQVLERSWEAGLHRIIICVQDLTESRKGLKIARRDKRLFTTVGCAPINCLQFEENGEPDLYLHQLKDIITLGKEKVVAIGECEINSFMTYYCPLNIQLKYLKIQVQMSILFDLPLIISLHGNDTPKLLLNITRCYPKLRAAVYCFDPSVEMIKKVVDAGFYIGLDTWSFLSEGTIEAVKIIPLDKILFQTSCPSNVIHHSFPTYWHVSKENLDLLRTKKEKWRPDFMVTGKNEPCNVRQVLDMAAFVTNMNKNDLAEQVYQNTMHLFFPEEIAVKMV